MLLVCTLLAAPALSDCINNQMSGLEQFANNWLNSNCAMPNWCYGSDFNQSQKVDFIDYAFIFGSREPLLLVDNGVCNVSIRNVVIGSPSTIESYAAQQLQSAFQEAAGVTPLINPATPSAVEIRLGVANRFSAGVGNSSDQAYAIRRTYDNKIELVGNSAAAVMWAVDDFCNEILHISWPIANDTPILDGGMQSTIAIANLCKVKVPDFYYRGWIIGDNSNGFGYTDLIGNWMAHNRQSTLYCPVEQLGSIGGNPYLKHLARGITTETTYHNFAWLVPASIYYDNINHPESYHPEYFPLIDGIRVKPRDSASFYVQLCLSNPDILNIVKSKITETFSSNFPKLKIFGIAQNDGSGGFCQCTNCLAWDGNQIGTGNYSNRVAHFFNLLSPWVAQRYPGRLLGMYGYAETQEAPEFNVADNVAITFAPCGRNYHKKLTDPTDLYNAEIIRKLIGWLSKSKDVHFWEYYFYPNMDCCPVPFSRRICEEYADLKQLGVKGVCSQTYPVDWPSMRVLAYTVSQCAWDTSLDYDAILSNYCSLAYGPAADTMKAYHLLYENTILERVPEFGSALQQFPGAFNLSEMNQMDSYLSSANAIAVANSNQANKSAVQEQYSIFQKFKTIAIDPATIPGIGPNVIRDPGAEINDPSWFTDTMSNIGDYSFSRSSNFKHSGNKSFEIKCEGMTGVARWVQLYVPVNPGKRFAYRFWVNSTEGSGGNCEIYVGGSSVPITVAWTNTEGNWVQIVVPEILTLDNTYINLYLHSLGEGTVYFDDLFLAKLPD